MTLSLTSYRLNLATLLVGSLLLAACSSTPNFSVESFEVDRLSWDSIRVSTSFKHAPTFGSEALVAPDVIVYTVFDSKFDTLYVGDDSRIAIPDKRMLDRERILVEACGFFRGASACEQRVVSASPKKVMADYEVFFPVDDRSYEKGEVELASTLYRQIFDTDEWEQIRKPSGKELSIFAYVDHAPDDRVRIPISRSRTSFVLSRYDGSRDLRYQIQSSLMDADSAVVMFDLYALSSVDPVLVTQQRIVLRSKSEQERSFEVRALVEEAASQILSRISSRFGSRRAYVFINEWTFESLAKSYRAEFELHWQDAFQGEWADLSGELYVKTNGSDGSFLFLRGSERAEKRWEDRIQAQTIDLDPIFVERESMSETEPR